MTEPTPYAAIIQPSTDPNTPESHRPVTLTMATTLDERQVTSQPGVYSQAHANQMITAASQYLESTQAASVRIDRFVFTVR